MRFHRSCESESSSWNVLRDRIADVGANVPDEPIADRTVLLTSPGVSERSTRGALVANCGGGVIDHGWLRMFADGFPAMPSLPEANPGGSPPTDDYLFIVFDVLGGRFAINGDSERAAPGEVCYFAPDTLEWITLEMGHTAFDYWALGAGVEQFYRDLRWPGWEHEIVALAIDQGLATYAPLFAEAGQQHPLKTRGASN